MNKNMDMNTNTCDGITDDIKQESIESCPLEKHKQTVSTSTKYLNEIKQFNDIQNELSESNLPNITQVNKEQKDTIFIQKLYLCQAKCDFFDTNDQMINLIDKKERILLELSKFISDHIWFKQNLFEKCLETISNNLFRSLPYQNTPTTLSYPDNDILQTYTEFEDPSWRHLKLIYELLWRVINTPQISTDIMTKYMTGKFLVSLIELFASQDKRERKYLLMILHKIYGRCLKLRPYIIDIMSSYFYRMIYYNEFNHVNGIVELLQMICAIIPGLTVPVHNSWHSFVRNVLIPLHKCSELQIFCQQLTQCCVNYITKYQDGGVVILGGLLKFWPQLPYKQEVFIMEAV
eukprot:547807_1